MVSTIGLMLWGLSTAAAQEVVVNIDQDVADTFGIDSTEASDGITSSINEGLNLVDQEAFLQSMANAAAMSSKGMGVDYASNIKRFMFGASFGSAVNSAGFSFGRGGRELPEDGFSFQVSAMAGLNLGFSNPDGFLGRVKLYANGMQLSTGGDSFNGTLTNLGGHLQLQLAKPRSGTGVEWGGLALTSGYDISQYSLDLVQALPVDTEIDGNDLSWSAEGTYTVAAETASVPVELSTNVRLAILTLYAGGGVDYNLVGEATSSISLAGPLDVSSSGQTATLGDASISMSGSAIADQLTPRFFGGAQVGLSVLKVYGHLNVGLNNSVGGHIGARVAL